MTSAPAPLPRTMRVFERGWLSSNNVVFDDGDAISVVDTGYATHAPQTVALIENAAAGRPLARIVNTHLHSDHVGGNAALARRHRARIWIPPGQAGAVAAWNEQQLSFTATAQHCERFGFDGLLRPGEAIELGGLRWEILAAAGHDPHMVMLFEEHHGVLISADALWENGFGAIFPELDGDGGFDAQRATLELAARRRPRVVIPGHGAPFTDVAAALERASRRLDALAASPERNAHHVLKVLIKFWLLQVREAEVARLVDLFSQAHYPRIIHERYFADRPFAAMIDRALADLGAAGAAALDGVRIRNLDG